ncbi:SDR family oxidoreductase [Amnimonas aquatica]|uniref:SDR family oxidoreductase n=1 Tax=Amnimonas aquatica TaxID=2094561 RepID=UPI003B96777D
MQAHRAGVFQMSKQAQKTVLITGASSGIGLATARHFQARGWNVAATMRNPADQPELAQLPNVICPALDVHDKDSIAQAIQITFERFGAIDVVVNNAGYALMGAFETLDEAQVRRQFETNVFGLMEVCRAVLPHFRQRRAGLLINVSSMVGRIPLPLYSVYNASKHAVEGFTEGLVYELEPFGVRVYQLLRTFLGPCQCHRRAGLQRLQRCAARRHGRDRAARLASAGCRQGDLAGRQRQQPSPALQRRHRCARAAGGPPPAARHPVPRHDQDQPQPCQLRHARPVHLPRQGLKAGMTREATP